MIAKPAAIDATCGSNTASSPAPSVEMSSGHSRLSSVRPGLSSGSVVCERAPASSRAIGGDVSARRPSHNPMSAATIHQPTLTRISVPPGSCEMPITVIAASAVAAPALSSTVALRKSPNRTVAGGRSVQQRAQEVAHAVGALDHRVGALLELGRTLVGPHADLGGMSDAAGLAQLVETGERVDVRHVVAHVDRGGKLAVSQQVDDARPLVDPHRRADLHHLLAPVDREAGLLRL